MTKQTIVLDTNFLIYCAKQKIDYVEEIKNLLSEDHKLIVPSQVITELKTLQVKAKKYSDKNAAKLSLALLKSNKINEVNVDGSYADEAILSLSKDRNIIIATHDRILKNKLRSKRLIVIQNIKKLALE